MQELTALLEPHAKQMDEWFRDGADDARHIAGRKPGWRKRLSTVHALYGLYAGYREQWDFVRKGAPLLSLPGWNIKLDKAATVTVGLTLNQHATRLPKRPFHKQYTVNACPHAGDCAAVCVLKNGHGRDPRVVKARKAKTEFLVFEPASFSYLLGYELQRAAIRYGTILFRPNVASDVRWEAILPSMTGGWIEGVTLYGYSKWPYVLDTDGWLDTAYRVAYSWNESSDPKAVLRFLAHGGSVAVVTSRRKGEPVGRFDAHFGLFGVVDADKTDEWIFKRAKIGDLSAKGKARSLIGRSGFVVSIN